MNLTTLTPTSISRFFAILLALLASSVASFAARSTISLDGTWKIADSKSAGELPDKFPARVSVPGLVNLAEPAFADVDAFFSREHLANRVRANLVPADWLTNYWKGKVNQDRNYFWYRKTFHAPKNRAVALLRVGKAQFGTAAYLNGTKLGEYAGCFTASYFHLENAIRWGEENTVLIRIGAHPAVLPDTYPTGSDFEKIKWTPGIYDSVSVIFSDNPSIESVQVAPRLATSEVVLQARIRNHGASTVRGSLRHHIKPWKAASETITGSPVPYELVAGEEKTFTQTVQLPNARLWSPEDPFLYVVNTATEGDTVSTRFGMREFHFDGETKKAYLNGKVYYLRGSNITLHRFFEDPLCKNLPWNERWVRKLLGDLPKKMHWNYFRFCIGPVPDKWLDICDEQGLLIQNEFFVWTGGPGWYQNYARQHDAAEMIRQYKDWMRDNWNHPSVAVWDANNETKDDIFHQTIIPAVRPLDLSNRPWENSYNPPAGPIDPVEDHPYLMQSGHMGKLNFSMTQLETMNGAPRKGVLPSEQHAPIINEYGWLWLNRDGTPTVLTENVYRQLMGGTNTTALQRLDLYSYLLAGKTEFWRAHRHYAGIIHFVYLTCSYPGVYTADHFADVERLKLDPAFADYMGEAFKPLGVYLNFFQPTMTGGARRDFKVMLVNDYPHPLDGTLVLSLEDTKGKVMATARQKFSMVAFGDQALNLPLDVPQVAGSFVLRARAVATGLKETTSSRRWVMIPLLR